MSDLPLATPSAGRTGEGADPAGYDPASPVVLLIEDDLDHARLIARVLAGSRFRLMHARDGEEGLAMARQHRLDIVLFDMGLPGIEGMEVALELRRDPAFNHLRFVVVSSWDQDMLRGNRFDAYIQKPIEVGKVVDTLEGVLAAAPRRGDGDSGEAPAV